MSSSTSSLFASELFELIAQGGQRFTVHSAVLAAQSEPLRIATTGPWRESRERVIDLQGWDEETVDRLLRFLYVGDYQVPNTPSLPPLAHAKVYALAQYKDVKALQTLALAHLNTNLTECRLIKPNAIIELLCYVHSNIYSPAKAEEEPMRHRVLHFAASNLQALEGLEMESLLSEGSGSTLACGFEFRFYRERVQKDIAQASLKEANEKLEELERVILNLRARVEASRYRSHPSKYRINWSDTAQDYFFAKADMV